MKIVNTLTILICLLFVACGEDNTCTRSDWAGTYVFQDKDCLDESIEFTDLLIIEEGMEENVIVIDGAEIIINGCNATFLELFDLELDGDKLKAGLVTGGCEAEYKKN